MESSKPEQTMQYLIYTHLWTYIIEIAYLVQMLDKVWVNRVQFSHLCMCEKVNFFPLHYTICLRLKAYGCQLLILNIPSGRLYTYVIKWTKECCIYIWAVKVDPWMQIVLATVFFCRVNSAYTFWDNAWSGSDAAVMLGMTERHPPWLSTLAL